MVYFDEPLNNFGYGIDILLISSHGDHILTSIHLTFSNYYLATNNIVEYNACILGLEIALELGIKHMKVCADCKLALLKISNMP